MRFPHIKKLDLQLLYYLAVLLEEKHVTRAAARCFLSQSAMSRQLDHLRKALGDELLLRNGRSHERTARESVYFVTWNPCCRAWRKS